MSCGRGGSDAGAPYTTRAGVTLGTASGVPVWLGGPLSTIHGVEDLVVSDLGLW